MWLTCQVERVGDVGQHGSGLLAHHLPVMAVRRRPVVWPVMSAMSLLSLRWLPTTSTAWVRQVWRCCQRARFVFGLPRFQGGLLGDRQHFHDRRFAAVFGLKRLGQLADTMLDRRAARGPQLGEFGGDADDFTHRPLTACRRRRRTPPRHARSAAPRCGCCTARRRPRRPCVVGCRPGPASAVFRRLRWPALCY